MSTTNDFLTEETFKKAKHLIRKISHTGEPEPDKKDLSDLKEICKNGKIDLISFIYKECMKHMHKKHSQVRLSTLKLLDYLFQKSHLIRKKLLDDFDLFLYLTLSIQQYQTTLSSLPPPKKYADLLKEHALKLIQRWHADFGPGYEKLRYAYKNMKEHNQSVFNDLQINDRQRSLRQQEEEDRRERILSRIIEIRTVDHEKIRPAILDIVAKIESLLDMLLSSSQNNIDLNDPLLLTQDEANKSTSQHEQQKRQHAITNLSQEIEIDFSPFIEIARNPENQVIVDQLKELKRELVVSKLPRLLGIEKVFVKKPSMSNTLKELIDLKNKAMNVVMKLNELRIVDESDSNERKKKTLDDAGSDDSEDNDFEEVQPKDGLETYIPKRLRYEYGLDPIDPREQVSVTLVEDSFTNNSPIPSSSKQVTMEPYKLNFDNIIGACNFRLENGRLCPRRDKYKCPFHGKIIPRDHNGVALDDQDREAEEKAWRLKNDVPDWQDPLLLMEIKRATGVDLTMPKKGKRATYLKKSLMNIKTSESTPKKRLEKKMKRLDR